MKCIIKWSWTGLDLWMPLFYEHFSVVLIKGITLKYQVEAGIYMCWAGAKATKANLISTKGALGICRSWEQVRQILIQPSAVKWESPIEALSEMEKDQKKLFYGDTKHTNLESLNNSIASIFSSQNYHKMFCILYTVHPSIYLVLGWSKWRKNFIQHSKRWISPWFSSESRFCFPCVVKTIKEDAFWILDGDEGKHWHSRLKHGQALLHTTVWEINQTFVEDFPFEMKTFQEETRIQEEAHVSVIFLKMYMCFFLDWSMVRLFYIASTTMQWDITLQYLWHEMDTRRMCSHCTVLWSSNCTIPWRLDLTWHL